MYLHPIVLLLLSHLFGDFIFQGNKIATQKSKSLKWLSIHVLIYTSVLTVISVFALDSKLLLDFVLINGILHWFTDLITSKINARLFQMENKHWFYMGIGVDQFIHGACLVYTYEYYTSLDSLPYFFQLIFG